MRSDATVLKKSVGGALRWMADRVGYSIINQDKFGLDPFNDIARLSAAWDYDVRVVFDVGANEGDASALALRRFPKARVFAFEPFEDSFESLNRRFTDISRFRAIASALGPEAGRRTFYVFDNNKLHSLLPQTPYTALHGNVPRKVEVDTTTVDRFCEEGGLRSIDVLKIDTEGFDLEVLRGAAAMLQRGGIKFVYCEFNDMAPRADVRGGALTPIVDLLAGSGHRFVAAYCDYVLADRGLFTVSNALFALPPAAKPSD